MNIPKILRHVAEAAMALCLAIMVAAVFLNVVLRYMYGTGVVITEELSRLLFIWLVSLGAILAFQEGKHLGFDLVVSRLGGISAAACRWITRVLIALSLYFLILGAWEQVIVGLNSNSPVMNYPLALAAGGIFTMGVFMALLLLVDIWLALRGHDHAAIPPSHVE